MATIAGSEIISSVAEKFSFISKLTLLSRATSDDNQPMPGYMYNEVNKITFESGSCCNDLVGWLNDRLSQRSCHVKFKVLRLMKFLVSNGHPQFRQELRKRSQEISFSAKHSGPPDALHGNAPYLAVREEAKELSQMLFQIADDDSAVPGTAQQSTNISLSNITGLGRFGDVPASNATSRLEGFGNVVDTPDKSLGDTMMRGLRNVADKMVDKMAEISSPDSRSADVTFVPTTVDKRFSTYRPVAVEPSTSDFDKHGALVRVKDSGQHRGPARQAAWQAPKPKHRPGVAGGGWDDDAKYSEKLIGIADSRDVIAAGQLSSSSSGLSDTNCCNISSTADGAVISMDVSYCRADEKIMERNLVNDLVLSHSCSSCSSVQDQQHEVDSDCFPTRQQLKVFINECSSVNCDVVVEFINDTLTSTNSNSIVMRALLSLEAILRTDLVQQDQISELCSAHLIHLYRDSHCKPVQQKTRKIIRILEKLAPNRSELFSSI